MNLELVEQARVVLDPCLKRWFFKKPYTVTIGEHEVIRKGANTSS